MSQRTVVYMVTGEEDLLRSLDASLNGNKNLTAVCGPVECDHPDEGLILGMAMAKDPAVGGDFDWLLGYLAGRAVTETVYKRDLDLIDAMRCESGVPAA